MLTICESLAAWLAAGRRRIGELEFQLIPDTNGILLYHWLDADALASQAETLEHHHGPAAARELSLFSQDGSYRFAKAQLNLRRGWLMTLANVAELHSALDQFYPAAAGLVAAMETGSLEVEHLRTKLARQTGMYRTANKISDASAQQLVREICGPNHQCAKRILWQLDEITPLDPSPASQYRGVPTDNESAAIPLLCREACNLMVAACREAVKKH